MDKAAGGETAAALREHRDLVAAEVLAVRVDEATGPEDGGVETGEAIGAAGHGDASAGPEDGDGMRVQRDHDAGEAVRTRAFEQVADEVLVAAVHAIELANGERAGSAWRDALQLLAGELGGHEEALRVASTAARRSRMWLGR